MRGTISHAIAAIFLLSRVCSPETIYLITQFETRLHIIDSSTPEDRTGVDITGLRLGDELVGIDFDALTGRLYAVGRDPVINNRTPATVYTIDPATGAATLQFLLPSSLGEDSHGVDIDFAQRRIHVTSTLGTSLFLDIDSGNATTGAVLSYPPGDENFGRVPAISGLAYPGQGGSPVYGIDISARALVSLPSPDTAELTTVGSLGLNRAVFGAAGFDISMETGIAYAVQGLAGDPVSFDLFRVDLATGTAASLGTVFEGFDPVVGIAVQPTPIPEPATMMYVAIGLIAAVWARTGRR
jgi:hypothetical protein